MKYNIVSKFPNSIIKHLNLNVEKLLKDCLSAKKKENFKIMIKVNLKR